MNFEHAMLNELTRPYYRICMLHIILTVLT